MGQLKYYTGKLGARKLVSHVTTESQPWTADTGALFLDFENLVLGAGGGQAGSGPIPQSAVSWLCRGFGNTAIRRAYANWRDERFGCYEKILAINGIDLIQMGRVAPGSHKNAADIRLAIDAMEMLLTHPDIRVFVLVTGDSDFTPLVQRLREFGKYVIGVGAEPTTSSRLVSVCSQYKFWEIITSQAPTAATATDTPSRGDVSAALALLRRAIDDSNTDTPTAGAVKNKILSLEPAFDEAHFGCRNFREFLVHVAGVEITGRSGNDVTITLPPAG